MKMVLQSSHARAKEIFDYQISKRVLNLWVQIRSLQRTSKHHRHEAEALSGIIRKRWAENRAMFESES